MEREMAERQTGLTYDDLLEMFPEESNRRHELLGRGETVESEALAGFSAAADEVLGPPEE